MGQLGSLSDIIKVQKRLISNKTANKNKECKPLDRFNLIKYNMNDYKQQSNFNIANIENFKQMEVNEKTNQLAIYSTIDYSEKENPSLKENDRLLYDLKYILDLKKKNCMNSL